MLIVWESVCSTSGKAVKLSKSRMGFKLEYINCDSKKLIACLEL